MKIKAIDLKYRYAYFVMLDGKLLTDCVVADEENGEAEVYILDRDDNCIFIDEILITKILTGNVKITFKWWLIPYQETINWWCRWFAFRKYYTIDGEHTVYTNGLLRFILTGSRI